MYTSESLAAMHIDHSSIVMFAKAHPDDEAVASGALMDALHQAGVAMHTVDVSDGEASTEGEPTLVQSGHRLKESAALNNTFDIPSSNQHALHLPDGDLRRYPHRLRLIGGLGRLIATTGATHLFVPALHRYEIEPHDDHEAVWRVGRALGRVLAFMDQPIGVWTHATTEKAWATLPVDADQKLSLLEHYPTQFTLSPDESGAADFFGRTVAPETARRLGQYTSLFVNEPYAPHTGVPLLRPTRELETVLAAIG